MKFPRRRWLLLAPLVFIAAGAGLVALESSKPPRPTRETFDRVRTGMTLTEVVETVGEPPGKTVGPPGRERRWTWDAPDCHLEVDFDSDERVVAVFANSKPRSSLWQRLRRGFGL